MPIRRGTWDDLSVEERSGYCLQRFPGLRFACFELRTPADDTHSVRFGYVVVLTSDGLQLIGKVVKLYPTARRKKPPDLEVRFGNGAGLWVGVAGAGNKRAFEWFCLETYLLGRRYPDPGSRRELLRVAEREQLWRAPSLSRDTGSKLEPTPATS